MLGHGPPPELVHYLCWLTDTEGMHDIIVFLPPCDHTELTLYRWWKGNWGNQIYSGVMMIRGLTVTPLATPANWYLIPAG